MGNRRDFLRLLGIGVGSLLTESMFSGCAVDPVTGQNVMIMMSEAEEIAMDKAYGPHQFSSDYGVLRDKSLNSYLSEVGNRLASLSHRPRMPYSFRAVNAVNINAYAFPGGSVAVTRGILLELESEAELAALLGHEIGHVNARHAAEQAAKGMLTNVLLSGMAVAIGAAGYGDVAGVAQELGGLGAGALLARYSRDNEREADGLGLEYMTRAGYSPLGMVGLMEILLKNSKNKPGAVEMMFATHPMSDERYRTASYASKNKYSSFRGNSVLRERYMDNTAGLRELRGVINHLQDAQVLMGKKDYSSAQAVIGKALNMKNDDYGSLVTMAQCLAAQKEFDSGASFADKASLVYPEEPQAHGLIGVCALNRKKFAEAYVAFTKYELLLPGNPDITFYKGFSLENLNDKVRASEDYAHYLQMVKKGSKAQHAYAKLKDWGYISKDVGQR
ncbi:MAG: M48 family metalloprotease [Desulfobulbaceae bacterium]|nr:M48 family metalloprotease [Desulfobulbaceae bacterium]